MRTIAVVDVITQYLMTFGPLLGDIKKKKFYLFMLDRLSIFKKYRPNVETRNPPEIPTNERIIKSTRNYFESIYVL